MRRLLPIAVAIALVGAVVGCVREISLAPTDAAQLHPDAADFVPDADVDAGFIPDASDDALPPADAATD